MPPDPGFRGAAGTARWVRATCAICPGRTIRYRLVIWAARSRARPCDRAARAAAVCGSATGSRSFPLRRLRSSSCRHHGTAASRLRQRICRAIVFQAAEVARSVGASDSSDCAVRPTPPVPMCGSPPPCLGAGRVSENSANPRRISFVADWCAGCRQSSTACGCRKRGCARRSSRLSRWISVWPASNRRDRSATSAARHASSAAPASTSSRHGRRPPGHACPGSGTGSRG
jgi:hypothetical protein